MISLRRIALAVMGLPALAILLIHLGVSWGPIHTIEQQSSFIFAVGVGLFMFSLRRSALLLLVGIVAGYLFMVFVLPPLLP